MISQATKRLLALCMGNMLEWYDFSIYLFFADPMSRYFFSSSNHHQAKLFIYATFFIGFMARPLGGLLIGWLSDRHNPARTMHRSILLMGVATALIPFIPSAETIGWLAPFALIFLRLLQGISAGGQYPGILTMMVNQKKGQACFYLGLMLGIATSGSAIASFLSWFTTAYFLHHHSTWLWRAPFCLNLIFLSLYLWLQQPEDNPPRLPRPKAIDSSLFEAIRKQTTTILGVVLLTIMGSALYYLVTGYLVDYEIHQLGFSASLARLATCLTLCAATCLYPITGWVADRSHHWTLFIGANAMLALCVPIFLEQLHHHPSTLTITSLMVIMITCIAVIQSTISPLFANRFESNWRTTCCAISFNIGNTLSGATPMLALIMVSALPNTGLALVFAALMGLGLIGFILMSQRSRIEPIKEAAAEQGY